MDLTRVYTDSVDADDNIVEFDYSDINEGEFGLCEVVLLV